MRIAFAGAHRTGKTTLVHALGEARPDYAVIEEPYHLLEEEGYDFADPPGAEDYLAMLERSLAISTSAPANALIDRSPLDFVAYLDVVAGDSFEADLLRDAMSALDLIVLVPIESRDRIVVAASEDRRLRRAVDEVLSAMVLDDPHDFGVEVLEVHGDVDQRVRQVLGRMSA